MIELIKKVNWLSKKMGTHPRKNVPSSPYALSPPSQKLDFVLKPP